MKLWMVIYIAGKIGGTVGPLPYDYDACVARSQSLYNDANKLVTTPQGYTAADVRFECELHAERPKNDPTAGTVR